MRSIYMERVPSWYELSFDRRTAAFVLKTEVWALVDAVRQIRLEKKPFTNIIEPASRIGNEEFAWARLVPDPGQPAFRLQLPRLGMIRRGRNDWDWQAGRRLAEVVSALLRGVNRTHGEPNSEEEQIATAETIVPQTGTIGYRLSGELSATAVERMGGERRDIPQAVTAMRSAAERLSGREENTRDFHAIVEENGFSLSCGWRVTLGSERHMRTIPGLGGRFGGSNIDSPWQQLTLLAGFAALCETLRAEVRQEKAPGVA